MKRMQSNTPFQSRSFLWQGILILLPVGVLTVVGLYSLRQDRLLAEQDAKELSAAIALRMAQAVGGAELTRQLRDYREANFSLHANRATDLGLMQWTGGSKTDEAEWRRVRAWEQANPGIDLPAMPVCDCVLDFRGEFSSPQIYPLSPPPPGWLSELSPEQRRLWQQEEKAEFVSNDPDAAQAALKNFIAAKPPGGARANAEFNLLLLKTRGLTPAEAAAQLADSAWSESAQLTEAGLPVGQLVCYRALRLLPDRAGIPLKLLRIIAQAISNCPSILSSRLIAEAQRVAPISAVDAWQSVAVLKAWWDSEEKTREVLRDFQQQHPLGARSNALLWVASSGGRFLLAPDYQPELDATTGRRGAPSSSPRRLVIFPEAVVDKALTAALAKADLSLPPYAVAGLEIGGSKLVLQGNQFSMGTNSLLLPILGDASGSLVALSEVPVESFPFRARIFLADSHLLYARQHQRTLLFGAIILASTFAALVGLMTAHRAFCRQQELNEMKSNFVSSVSHELRAPIASMRLLAESLERGKIAGEVKQKEYFGLLVQESRRLSMLIENILDFSRIERGSKKYEFEPADLGALAEDTVRLMRPCSAERRVELELRQNGAAGAEPFACDGLALQQALINLIDNAIKHSPPGSRVAVGLEGGAAEVCLWVEDSGPGIPPEEHEKIFERFYRRGSELRRETQGIGIGLTIVKHIVEAHGGRVTVRSAPGQGSRFTMELPRT
jgi:signal transduction histidine kinase